MAVRVISTRLAVDGETEYKRAIESVNGTLRTMKAELSYTESAFRGQANTLTALTEKQRIQKDMVDQQAEKIRSLEDAVAEATKVYGEHDTRTEKWKKSLFEAKKELANMENQLAQTTQHLQEAQDSTDKCATSIDGFGKEVKNSGSEVEDVDRRLRSLQEELGYTEASFRGQANTVEALTAKKRLLRKEIEQQTEKVRTLEKAMDRAADAYGDGNKRTEEYRQSLYKAKRELVDMEDELKDTYKYLNEANNSADKCAKSIDEFGREVKGAGDDLDGFDLKGLLSNLEDLKGMLVGGTAGAAIIAGVKEISGAILDLEESTREYRTIMGSLEVSSQNAGYTAKQTKEAFVRLYGVLGDTQTAATTVANLQAIGLSQEDLIQIIDGCTGAWSKYGDSIPIDGLAESINETIRSGEVTGTFADVLNWGSEELETFGVKLKENIEFTELSKKELEKLTESELADYEAKLAQYEATETWNEAVQDATASEDFFNLALQECETQSEKTQLMMDYLKQQGLIPLGEEWRNVNEDIIEANESEAELEAAWGRLGETLSPVADGLRSFGADAVNWLADQVDGLIESISSAIDWFEKLNKSLNDGGNERMEQAGYEAYYNEDGLLRYRKVDGSHAEGLDFVPFDGYTAELHYGERIMTAVENTALDTLTRAVSALEGAAHGGQAPARETVIEKVQTVTIPVQVVLNDRIVGESTTTYQMRQRRAAGT